MFIDREIQGRTESGLQNLLKCLGSLDFVLLDLSYLAIFCYLIYVFLFEAQLLFSWHCHSVGGLIQCSNNTVVLFYA